MLYWGFLSFCAFCLFIYFILAVLGLCCCARAFSSSCGKQVYSLTAVPCGTRARGVQALVVVVHRFSCPATCGTLPDQRSDPYPLHWQADSFNGFLILILISFGRSDFLWLWREGATFTAVRRLLIAAAALAAEHRLQARRSQQMHTWAQELAA